MRTRTIFIILLILVLLIGLGPALLGLGSQEIAEAFGCQVNSIGARIRDRLSTISAS
jgi:hypothetical protein